MNSNCVNFLFGILEIKALPVLFVRKIISCVLLSLQPISKEWVTDKVSTFVFCYQVFVQQSSYCSIYNRSKGIYVYVIGVIIFFYLIFFC